jgi:hypothetical protein
MSDDNDDKIFNETKNKLDIKDSRIPFTLQKTDLFHYLS